MQQQFPSELAAISFPSVIDAHAETHGDAMRVRALNPSDFPDSTSPLLMLHHFELFQDFFAPHPHAGFSAVTYLFPDSATGMRNHDSLGALIDIEPGDLYWTFAGRGVLHHERPVALGSRCHGLQFFINASASRKHDPPHALHLPSAQVPLIQSAEGATARLLAGASHGLRAPIDTPEPFTMLDLKLSTGGSFSYTVPSGWSATLYVHEGQLHATLGHAAPTPLHRSQAVSTPESDQPQTLTLTGDAQAILFSGPILHEPVFMGGPFVMTSQEELRQAFADYRAGRMGTLATTTAAAPTTRP